MHLRTTINMVALHSGKTFHLTQSQYTDTGPTSPSTDQEEEEEEEEDGEGEGGGEGEGEQLEEDDEKDVVEEEE